MNPLNSEFNLNEAKRKDIHQINIISTLKESPIFIQKLLTNRYMNLSFQQLIQLTQPNNLSEIQKINLPRNFISLLSTIGNNDAFTNIYPFCIDPIRFPLQKEQVKQFPESIKLVYISNYAGIITEDLQILFKDAIEQIFQNPTLFCPEIFWIFIFKWSKHIINEAIQSLDINGFPKEYLYDLFQNFELPSKILNKFRISELNKINDEEKSVFILNILLKNYIQNKKFEIIKNIDINNFNDNEIECFTKNCYNYMTKNQINSINTSNLTKETALLFIQNNIKKLSQIQINQINFAETEIAQIIIDSNHLQNLSQIQIQSINILEIDDQFLQKLLKYLNDINHFDFLSSEQISNIQIDHIDISAQKNFIQVAANYMKDEEIKKINFESFQNDQNAIISILQTLNKFNKLEILNNEQIYQINIYFLNDEELINSMLNIPLFVNFFIRINCNSINNETIPLIDFGNVNIGFLNYFINSRIDELSNEQIQQINLNYLEKVVIEKLLLCKIDVLKNESIQSISLDNLDKEVVNLIVMKKYDIINKNQVESIDINLLSIDNQQNLLNFRLDDLNENQIQNFDTRNIEIAKLCLDKKFDLLTQNQINSIEIAKLELKHIEMIFNSKNANFDYLKTNIIQMVDLTKIKEFNYDIYFDLILLKPKDLSIEQFMTIDWYKGHFKFAIAARIFMKKIGMNRDFEEILIGDEEITEEKLKLMPNEFNIAAINSRLLNNNYDFIPIQLRSYYFQAIQVMFKLSDKFSQSIEYIINNWSIDSRDSLAAIITDLKIISFSKDAINSLLKYYLFDLSDTQIQSLNLSNVSEEILDEALLNRANSFLVEQFSDIPYSKSNQISLQLHLLADDSIPNLYIKDLTEILVNFLVNKKLNLLNKDQIQNIDITNLKPICFNKLINDRVQDLSTKQIKSIVISKLNQKQLNHLVTYRAESMSERQIKKIDLKNLSKDALSSLFQKNKNKIPNENIKSQITSKALNNLDPQVLFDFLKTHINILTVNQIKKINVSSPDIAAILIKEHHQNLSKNQIQKIDWSENSPINQVFKSNGDSLSTMNVLIKIRRFKDLTKEQFDNSINYEKNENIIEIMKENLLNSITKKNVEKINLVEIKKKVVKKLYLKLLDSCMAKFSDEQIHILNTEDNTITELIIKHGCEKILTINQIQKIGINKILQSDLNKLILTRSKDFSQEQVQSIKIDKIDFYQYNYIKSYYRSNYISIDAIKVLLKNHIKSLTTHQIQSIKINDDSINAILLYNRINDLSTSQIEYFNLESINRYLEQTNFPKNIYQLLRESHRFNDLSRYQLNKIILLNGENAIEILHENLLDKIDGNRLEIKINEIKEINYEDYLKILQCFIKRLYFKTFEKIDASDYNVAQIIIQKNAISDLSSEQKNNFNTKSLLYLDDNQLVELAFPYNSGHKNYHIVNGIILFKYLKNKIRNGPIAEYVEKLLNRIKCKIILFNFIIIAENELKSEKISFESISNEFFNTFEKLPTFEFYLVEHHIKSNQISLNTLQIYLLQKAKQCKNINDINKFINFQSSFVKKLPEEYKNSISKISLEKKGIKGNSVFEVYLKKENTIINRLTQKPEN